MRRFARLEQLIGTERTAVLTGSHVAVIGLGAVGSYAVEALARSAVGRLTLVDFDVVSPSNLNRQLFALESTIGMAKTEVARRRVLDINPQCRVQVRHVFVDGGNVRDELSCRPDVIIDAIDVVASKVDLLREAVSMNLAVISSMGAAARLDPSAVMVADLSRTRVCPLARIIRKKLQRFGVRTGIRCVFSTESAQNRLPVPDEDWEPSDTGRSRAPIGSICHMPAIFGLRAAAEAVSHILGMNPAET
ncbi:MAG: tRNA threonylcarbamoyladenosine dehydratase [Desulfobacterales bacterium]|nr:tRNA threonylcarbamoyladenosine dehydratase [Desulfobacterales bacterium]